MVGEATRTQVIEVAERLFAERGVNGVSLREIGVAAGQRNTGVVRYHFGSKEGLIEAVFRHRMEPINAAREAMLAASDPADLRALAEAFLYPLSAQLGDVGRPSWYLRFCLHAAYVMGMPPGNLPRQPWTEGLHILHERFDVLLADQRVPPAVRADRWFLFTGHIATALASRELAIQHGGQGLSDRELFLAGLVDTAVGVATAPVSAQTARLARAARSA